MTNPATSTSYRDSVVMVFAATSGQFYHEETTLCHLEGLFHHDNSILTNNFSSDYRSRLLSGLQKPRNR
jgi:hypothetical protein